MFTTGGFIQIANSTFDHNLGSLYTFNNNLTFSGNVTFENCVKPPQANKTVAEDVFVLQEGGAVTSYQSTVTFIGVSTLLNNQARHGGAILAAESTVITQGKTTIAHNMAKNSSGGGNLEINGNCIVTHNHATRGGGGIHASSSSISVHKFGALQVINNTAENGGGLYLKVNTRQYLLNCYANMLMKDEALLMFTGNHATYGGAVYVADDTNSDACLSNTECFIQTLRLYQRTSVSHEAWIISRDITLAVDSNLDKYCEYFLC